MSAYRCEPREELRGVDGWHWLTGHNPVLWIADRQEWQWGEDDWVTPEAAYRYDYRYLAPVATPAEVERLRAEVERLQEALIPLVAVIPDICDALDLDPNETSIRVRVDGGARDGEVLAERTLTDMLTAARAALAKEPGNEG
jgi:hypothetical protein